MAMVVGEVSSEKLKSRLCVILFWAQICFADSARKEKEFVVFIVAAHLIHVKTARTKTSNTGTAKKSRNPEFDGDVAVSIR